MADIPGCEVQARISVGRRDPIKSRTGTHSTARSRESTTAATATTQLPSCSPCPTIIADDLSVLEGDQLRQAVPELVENARNANRIWAPRTAKSVTLGETPLALPRAPTSVSSANATLSLLDTRGRLKCGTPAGQDRPSTDYNGSSGKSHS